MEGPYGTGARAYPCNHTDGGNPRMGVSIPRAVEARYQAEAREIPAMDRSGKPSSPAKTRSGHGSRKAILDVIQ